MEQQHQYLYNMYYTFILRLACIRAQHEYSSIITVSFFKPPSHTQGHTHIVISTISFIFDVFMHYIQWQIVWRNVSSRAWSGVVWDEDRWKRCFQESSNATQYYTIMCAIVSHIYDFICYWLLRHRSSDFIQISVTHVLDAYFHKPMVFSSCSSSSASVADAVVFL